MKIGFWVGVAVAGTIIVATLVEDVITAGAGVVDDVASIGVAANSFKNVTYYGFKLVFG